MNSHDYGAYLIQSQTQSNVARMNTIMSNRQMRTAPQMEDITAAYSADEIRRQSTLAERPSVYRFIRFTANSKFSHDSMRSASTINWTFSNQGTERGSISARTDLIDSVVGVEVHPFYVPSSIFTGGDLHYNRVHVYLGAISNPDFILYDYRGDVNQPQSFPYHYECVVGPEANRMRLISPIEPRMIFSSPIAILDNSWRVAMSNYSRPMLFPPSVLEATTLAASNPMALTVLGHGLSTGDLITIDTGVFAQYVNNTAYAITVVDANTISIDGVSSTSTPQAPAIPTGTRMNITALSRVIRIPTTLICVDRRPGAPIGVGSSLTL